MRRYLLAILFLVPLLTHAQYTSDGFYRVQNLGSQRYIYVTDNTGSINYQTTSAEMGAVQLWRGFDKTISDPATVIYIKKQDEKKYDLIAQGTGVHSIINYYVNVYELSDGTYNVYAEGKYLCDNDFSDEERGYLGAERKGDYRKWIIYPIDLEKNYFGIRSNLEVGGRFFKSFYADFAFSFASSGMKAWYVSDIKPEAVIISQLSSEIISDRTPIIIECNGTEASNNKLQLYKSQGTSVKDNLLKGVYFLNVERKNRSKDACTVYDKSTMRVLGKMSNGKLGYITGAMEYLPANESYLVVPAGTPSELPVMTITEYEEYKKLLEDNRNALNSLDNLSEDVKQSINVTKDFILSECKDVADRFIAMVDQLEGKLNSIRTSYSSSYSNLTLADNYDYFKSELSEILSSLSVIKSDAIKAEEEYIKAGINSISEDTVVTIFDLSGRKVERITVPGVYIVNNKKVYME